MTYKYNVTIKYSRHPFHADGTVDKTKKESSSWSTTVYNNGLKMTESQVKDTARKQFEKGKLNCLKIENVRIDKREEY